MRSPNVRRAALAGRPRENDHSAKEINAAEDSDALRLRQAARLAGWCRLSLPLARVVAELAYPAGRAA